MSSVSRRDIVWAVAFVEALRRQPGRPPKPSYAEAIAGIDAEQKWLNSRAVKAADHADRAVAALDSLDDSA